MLGPVGILLIVGGSLLLVFNNGANVFALAARPASPSQVRAFATITAELPSATPKPVPTATMVPRATATPDLASTQLLAIQETQAALQSAVATSTATVIFDIRHDMPQGNALRGQKQIRMTGCSACHISQDGLAVPIGPNWLAAPDSQGQSLAVRAEAHYKAVDYHGQATSVQQYLLESIVAPDAYIVPGNPTYGQNGQSIMPHDYGAKLTEQDLADIVEYLLNQQPMQLVDGMVQNFVPAGEFLMGAASTDGQSNPDERPQHRVHLDGFWIDGTEITNKQFDHFVADRGYQTEAERNGGSYIWNGSSWSYIAGASWRQPDGQPLQIGGSAGSYPVVEVSWNDAAAYCAWAGRRLPTEAEWEKAARGPVGLLYPWGNSPPDSTLANFESNHAGLTAVGSFANGASPYGAYDMAGNVYEWVADWYGANYYSASLSDNPRGSATGKYRVMRGGSWQLDAPRLRGLVREVSPPGLANNNLGFRCAADATAAPAATPAQAAATASSPQAANCSSSPSGLFAHLWSQFQDTLGCPQYSSPRAIQDAEELFRKGHMFWRADIDVYYVVYDGGGATEGAWSQYPGKYDDGGLAACGEAAPTGLGRHCPPA